MPVVKMSVVPYKETVLDDLVRHLEELERRLPIHARRAAAIPGGAPYSVEYLLRTGTYLSKARQATGLSRRELADRMGVYASRVRFSELGLLAGDEVNEIDWFSQLYAAALGKPELYAEFQRQFPEIKPTRILFHITNPFVDEEDGMREFVSYTPQNFLLRRQLYNIHMEGIISGMPQEERESFIRAHPFAYRVEKVA